MHKTIKNILIIVFIAGFVVGLAWWFARKKPQTILQYIISKTHMQKVDQNAQSEIVFFGDSITALEDWDVLFGVSSIYNAGVSGDTTEDLISRMNQATGQKPQKLFLMIGVNDLLQGKSVDYVANNYKNILDQIKISSPDTEVYVQSVLPVNSDILNWEHVDAQEIIELNARIKKLTAQNGDIFINLYPHFCGPDNKLYAQYTADGLHPNSYGYATWKDLIAEHIK